MAADAVGPTHDDTGIIERGIPHRALMLPEIVDRIFFFFTLIEADGPRRRLGELARKDPSKSYRFTLPPTLITSFICVNKLWASIAIAQIWRQPVARRHTLLELLRRIKDPLKRQFYAGLVVHGYITALHAWHPNMCSSLKTDEEEICRTEFPRMKALTIKVSPSLMLEFSHRIPEIKGEKVSELKIVLERPADPFGGFRFVHAVQMDVIMEQVCKIFTNVEILEIEGPCEMRTATAANVRKAMPKLKRFEHDGAVFLD
ncbi:hypothetical protein AAP_03282 [Ascosphaera apis ARSEF 7405]|uniref:Uncharacterized protein n=1 Tax=Ascosphaera apis ARSEF 7405 TaxID=392613 RepID=A0A167YNW2_9EURO|nr:hypothetical protein AAP_03282 [Ascosphaera apis ARSEF 7405]